MANASGMDQEVEAAPGLADRFTTSGCAGPVRILSAGECRDFLRSARRERDQPPLDWSKGYGACSPQFFKISTHPALVRMLTTILGDDFLLWGARVMVRRPGETHPWHTDIETADAVGGTVTVWIGLENTHRDSSLLLIPYSHRLGISVQESRTLRGRTRSETSTDEVVQWARERDERCHLATHDISDGEALFMDGRLWHGSRNDREHTRQAILLQYATPEVVIRMPDAKDFNWPFRKLESPRPPCVMIQGSDPVGVNRIVDPPLIREKEGGAQMPPGVFPLLLPLGADNKEGWKPYPFFKGATSGIQNLSCHVSALNHGCCPHPPHRHEEEEIVLMLDGEADLFLPDLPAEGGGQRMRLRPGEFVFYPAQFTHTLETVSRCPANYLMFKWKNPLARGSAELQGGELPLAFGHFKFMDQTDISRDERPLPRRRVIEGPTGCLKTLHCHLSTMAPGTGYAPHCDAYDVAMIVLEGEIETLGQRAKPHSVIFYPAGQPHGLRSTGTTAAIYVVFEFHGLQQVTGKSSYVLPHWTHSRLTRPAYWKQRFKRISRSIRKRLP